MAEEEHPQFYNTLSRRKELFQPIDEDNVRMYVCGPTVYDFAHIGNARPVIVFDVLFRLLNHLYDDKVTYVRNITDVDDKINARALRDYPHLPLNEAIRIVTEKTANQFHEDVKALGCLEPTVEPRATEHIDGMIDMIQTLLDKGHAYIAEGAEGLEALFDVQSMPDYGVLSNRKLEDQQAGARIDVKDHKKNPGDFVLWKQSSADEPGWDATFKVEGKSTDVRGRPGWHIECSVMSKHHLGETFDIHGGGLDLIFPHHENEIAQSCCSHGTDKMASIWMHNGYLQVEGRKMSKSDGNFVTIYDLLHTEKFGGRKWPGEVLRLAMLMTHYREPIDFSVKRLEEAEKILERWRAPLRSGAVQEGDYVKTELPKAFLSPLMDDLNLPKAIQRLHEIATLAFGVSAGHEIPYNELFQPSFNKLHTALSILGFDLFAYKEEKIDQGLEDFVDEQIIWRSNCIADKNWAEADRIRDDLLEQGIQLKDGKDPDTGERVTTWELVR